MSTIKDVTNNQLATFLSLTKLEVDKSLELVKKAPLGIGLIGKAADSKWVQLLSLLQVKTGINKSFKLLQGDFESITTQSLIQRTIQMDFSKYSEDTLTYLLLRNICILDQKENLASQKSYSSKIVTFIGFALLTACSLYLGSHPILYTIHFLKKTKIFFAFLSFLIACVFGVNAVYSIDAAFFGVNQKLTKEQFLQIEERCLAILGKEKILKVFNELQRKEEPLNNKQALQNQLSLLSKLQDKITLKKFQASLGFIEKY